MKHIIKDFYPNQGQFLVDDKIEFVVECNKRIDPIDVILVIRIMHLEEEVLSQNIVIKLMPCNEINNHIIELPSIGVGGYGVNVGVYIEQKLIQRFNTAFDVGVNHKAFPRYGFLSDFSKADENDAKDIISMKKLHINLVQFYDWMFRHETLVSAEDNYTDLMGKEMSKTAVKNKVDLCHQHGMKAMAYGAIYAASKDFYEQHPSWGLVNSHDCPITFINIFYIMNIKKDCPWHQHIINEYSKAIQELGFDGIHMDTYGFPKKGYGYGGKQEELIELDKEFPVLINHTKEQLSSCGNDVTIIFNNVGNWPVYSTAFSKQDMIYVEVWKPYTTYEHIQGIIREARGFTTKPIIISAYIKPFMGVNHEAAGYALKLLTAAIVSNGASHLIMGENQGILTQGYYVDYYYLEDDLYGEMRAYYDFMIRYFELFYDQSLKDVSMTHAYGDNLEYVFSGSNCSPSAESDRLWTVIRENNHMKLISLISLIGNDNLWNEPKENPGSVDELTINFQIEKSGLQVYVTSPCLKELKEIPFEIIDGERGKEVSFTIKELNIWTVVLVKMD